MVGDILYSRVARSNILGLSTFGANITLCGPNTLIPNEFLSDKHLYKNITFEHSLNKAVKNGVNSLVLFANGNQRNKVPREIINPKT